MTTEKEQKKLKVKKVKKQPRIESESVRKLFYGLIKKRYLIEKEIDENKFDKDSEEFKAYLKKYEHCFPRNNTAKLTSFSAEILRQQQDGTSLPYSLFQDKDIILDETDVEKLNELQNDLYYNILTKMYTKKKEDLNIIIAKSFFKHINTKELKKEEKDGYKDWIKIIEDLKVKITELEDFETKIKDQKKEIEWDRDYKSLTSNIVFKNLCLKSELQAKEQYELDIKKLNEEIEKITKELEEKNQEFEKITKEFNQKKEDLEKITKEKKELEVKIKTLEAKNQESEKMKEKLEQTTNKKTKEYEENLQKLNSEKEKTTKELNNQIKNNEISKQESEKMKEKIEQITKELEEKNKELKNLKEEKETLKEGKETSEQKIEELTELLERFNTQIEPFNKRLQKLDEEIQKEYNKLQLNNKLAQFIKNDIFKKNAKDVALRVFDKINNNDELNIDEKIELLKDFTLLNKDNFHKEKELLKSLFNVRANGECSKYINLLSRINNKNSKQKYDLSDYDYVLLGRLVDSILNGIQDLPSYGQYGQDNQDENKYLADFFNKLKDSLMNDRKTIKEDIKNKERTFDKNKVKELVDYYLFVKTFSKKSADLNLNDLFKVYNEEVYNKKDAKTKKHLIEGELKGELKAEEIAVEDKWFEGKSINIKQFIEKINKKFDKIFNNIYKVEEKNTGYYLKDYDEILKNKGLALVGKDLLGKGMEKLIYAVPITGDLTSKEGKFYITNNADLVGKLIQERMDIINDYKKLFKKTKLVKRERYKKDVFVNYYMLLMAILIYQQVSNMYDKDICEKMYADKDINDYIDINILDNKIIEHLCYKLTNYGKEKKEGLVNAIKNLKIRNDIEINLNNNFLRSLRESELVSEMEIFDKQGVLNSEVKEDLYKLNNFFAKQKFTVGKLEQFIYKLFDKMKSKGEDKSKNNEVKNNDEIEELEGESIDNVESNNNNVGSQKFNNMDVMEESNNQESNNDNGMGNNEEEEDIIEEYEDIDEEQTKKQEIEEQTKRQEIQNKYEDQTAKIEEYDDEEGLNESLETACSEFEKSFYITDDYQQRFEDAKKAFRTEESLPVGYSDRLKEEKKMHFYGKGCRLDSAMLLMWGETQFKYYNESTMEKADGKWKNKDNIFIRGENLEAEIERLAKENNITDIPIFSMKLEDWINDTEENQKKCLFIKHNYNKYGFRSDDSLNYDCKFLSPEARNRAAINDITEDDHSRNRMYQIYVKDGKIFVIVGPQFDLDLTNPGMEYNRYGGRGIPDRDSIFTKDNIEKVFKEIKFSTAATPEEMCATAKYIVDKPESDPKNMVNNDDLIKLIDKNILHYFTLMKTIENLFLGCRQDLAAVIYGAKNNKEGYGDLTTAEYSECINKLQDCVNIMQVEQKKIKVGKKASVDSYIFNDNEGVLFSQITEIKDEDIKKIQTTLEEIAGKVRDKKFCIKYNDDNSGMVCDLFNDKDESFYLNLGEKLNMFGTCNKIVNHLQKYIKELYTFKAKELGKDEKFLNEYNKTIENENKEKLKGIKDIEETCYIMEDDDGKEIKLLNIDGLLYKYENGTPSDIFSNLLYKRFEEMPNAKTCCEADNKRYGYEMITLNGREYKVFSFGNRYYYETEIEKGGKKYKKYAQFNDKHTNEIKEYIKKQFNNKITNKDKLCVNNVDYCCFFGKYYRKDAEKERQLCWNNFYDFINKEVGSCGADMDKEKQDEYFDKLKNFGMYFNNVIIQKINEGKIKLKGTKTIKDEDRVKETIYLFEAKNNKGENFEFGLKYNRIGRLICAGSMNGDKLLNGIAIGRGDSYIETVLHQGNNKIIGLDYDDKSGKIEMGKIICEDKVVGEEGIFDIKEEEEPEIVQDMPQFIEKEQLENILNGQEKIKKEQWSSIPKDSKDLEVVRETEDEIVNKIKSNLKRQFNNEKDNNKNYSNKLKINNINGKYWQLSSDEKDIFECKDEDLIEFAKAEKHFISNNLEIAKIETTNKKDEIFKKLEIKNGEIKLLDITKDKNFEVARKYIDGSNKTKEILNDINTIILGKEKYQIGKNGDIRKYEKNDEKLLKFNKENKNVFRYPEDCPVFEFKQIGGKWSKKIEDENKFLKVVEISEDEKKVMDFVNEKDPKNIFNFKLPNGQVLKFKQIGGKWSKMIEDKNKFLKVIEVSKNEQNIIEFDKNKDKFEKKNIKIDTDGKEIEIFVKKDIVNQKEVETGFFRVVIEDNTFKVINLLTEDKDNLLLLYKFQQNEANNGCFDMPIIPDYEVNNDIIKTICVTKIGKKVYKRLNPGGKYKVEELDENEKNIFNFYYGSNKEKQEDEYETTDINDHAVTYKMVNGELFKLYTNTNDKRKTKNKKYFYKCVSCKGDSNEQKVYEYLKDLDNNTKLYVYSSIDEQQEDKNSQEKITERTYKTNNEPLDIVYSCKNDERTDYRYQVKLKGDGNTKIVDCSPDLVDFLNNKKSLSISRGERCFDFKEKENGKYCKVVKNKKGECEIKDFDEEDKNFIKFCKEDSYDKNTWFVDTGKGFTFDGKNYYIPNIPDVHEENDCKDCTIDYMMKEKSGVRTIIKCNEKQKEIINFYTSANTNYTDYNDFELGKNKTTKIARSIKDGKIYKYDYSDYENDKIQELSDPEKLLYEFYKIYKKDPVNAALNKNQDGDDKNIKTKMAKLGDNIYKLVEEEVGNYQIVKCNENEKLLYEFYKEGYYCIPLNKNQEGDDDDIKTKMTDLGDKLYKLVEIDEEGNYQIVECDENEKLLYEFKTTEEKKYKIQLKPKKNTIMTKLQDGAIYKQEIDEKGNYKIVKCNKNDKLLYDFSFADFFDIDKDVTAARLGEKYYKKTLDKNNNYIISEITKQEDFEKLANTIISFVGKDNGVRFISHKGVKFVKTDLEYEGVEEYCCISEYNGKIVVKPCSEVEKKLIESFADSFEIDGERYFILNEKDKKTNKEVVVFNRIINGKDNQLDTYKPVTNFKDLAEKLKKNFDTVDLNDKNKTIIVKISDDKFVEISKDGNNTKITQCQKDKWETFEEEQNYTFDICDKNRQYKCFIHNVKNDRTGNIESKFYFIKEGYNKTDYIHVKPNSELGQMINDIFGKGIYHDEISNKNRQYDNKFITSDGKKIISGAFKKEFIIRDGISVEKFDDYENISEKNTFYIDEKGHIRNFDVIDDLKKQLQTEITIQNKLAEKFANNDFHHVKEGDIEMDVFKLDGKLYKMRDDKKQLFEEIQPKKEVKKEKKDMLGIDEIKPQSINTRKVDERGFFNHTGIKYKIQSAVKQMSRTADKLCNSNTKVGKKRTKTGIQQKQINSNNKKQSGYGTGSVFNKNGKEINNKTTYSGLNKNKKPIKCPKWFDSKKLDVANLNDDDWALISKGKFFDKFNKMQENNKKNKRVINEKFEINYVKAREYNKKHFNKTNLNGFFNKRKYLNNAKGDFNGKTSKKQKGI